MHFHIIMTQEEAFTILKTGANVFLTGAAGSGKTYLLNEFIRFLKSRGIGVGVTASTGIAATHLGGLTIHSWAGIGIGRQASDIDIRVMASNRRVAKRFSRNDVLIIDEISMLDADRLNIVDRVARVAKGNFKPFGGMQVVLCGDFFQLPPVAKNGEPQPRFAYHASAWKNANIKVCYLNEQYRQGDREFLEVLNAIRSAVVDEVVVSRLQARRTAVPTQKRITKLYSHNVDVDAENSRELARLLDKERHYRMETRGIPAIAEALKKGCLAPEVLTLKKGAAVMFVKNNFEKGYVNGTLGVIADFDEFGFPIVNAFNGKKFIADPASWSIEENGRVIAEIKQIPLRLAWAITIHKSQGMTLDAAEIDLSDAFEKGMGYVALSRVRSLKGIRLLGLNSTALEVHPEISAKDAELRELSNNALEAYRAKSSKEIAKLHNGFIRACGGEPTAEYGNSETPLYDTHFFPPPRRNHVRKERRWERTFTMILEGKTIREVARRRGRKEGTIINHLEVLQAAGKLNTQSMLHLGDGQEDAIDEIHTVFRQLGSEKLKPIYDAFGGRHTYETIRIARLLFAE